MKFSAFKKTCRFFAVVALLAVPHAFAHAPFDCTARVIVHADSAEVMVTVGTTLGENFLRAARLDPRQLPNGRPFALPPGLATNFLRWPPTEKIPHRARRA